MNLRKISSSPATKSDRLRGALGGRRFGFSETGKRFLLQDLWCYRTHIGTVGALWRAASNRVVSEANDRMRSFAGVSVVDVDVDTFYVSVSHGQAKVGEVGDWMIGASPTSHGVSRWKATELDLRSLLGLDVREQAYRLRAWADAALVEIARLVEHELDIVAQHTYRTDAANGRQFVLGIRRPWTARHSAGLGFVTSRWGVGSVDDASDAKPKHHPTSRQP